MQLSFDFDQSKTYKDSTFERTQKKIFMKQARVLCR